MDELERLKKDWKSRESQLPKLSTQEIYQMMLAKSSSSVRWIFYISIFELCLGLLFILCSPPPSVVEGVILPKFVEYLTWSTLIIPIYFSYRFYKNYRRITTTSSVKILMENILKSRKTLRLYIIINLCVGALIGVFTFIYVYILQKGGWVQFNQEASIQEYLIIFIVSVLTMALIMGMILGFYLLLYGILMRRLNKNYKELQKTTH